MPSVVPGLVPVAAALADYTKSHFNLLQYVPGGGTALFWESLAAGRRPWPPSDAASVNASPLARAGAAASRGKGALLGGRAGGCNWDDRGRTDPIQRLKGTTLATPRHASCSRATSRRCAAASWPSPASMATVLESLFDSSCSCR